MQEILLESPWIVGFAGMALIVATLIGWVQTGQRVALSIALILILVTVIAIGVSIYVETDSEKIRVIVHQAAEDLQNKRNAKVLALVHPNATSSVRKIASELSAYEFREVKITAIHEIFLEPDHQPPKMVVRLNSMVDGSVQGFSGKGVRYIEISFLKSQERWFVYDLTHEEPTYFMRNP